MAEFSFDVRLCGTVYIDAESEEAARAILRQHAGTPDNLAGGELSKRDIALDDDGFVRLSPAVTFYGEWPDDPAPAVALNISPAGAAALADCADIGFEGLEGVTEQAMLDVAGAIVALREAGQGQPAAPPSQRWTANGVHVGGFYLDGKHVGSVRGDDIEAPRMAERIAAGMNKAEG
jgi:hypothetical protein